MKTHAKGEAPTEQKRERISRFLLDSEISEPNLGNTEPHPTDDFQRIYELFRETRNRKSEAPKMPK